MLNEEQIKQLQPKLQKFEQERMIERYTYLGMLSEYQLISNNLVQPIVYTNLNPKQHFLFKRVLHGLRLYSKEDISKMHWDKKRRIIKVWKRAQDVINRWKQKLCYNDSQKIFAIFASSKLGKAFYEQPFDYMSDYQNKLPLKEVGIDYEHLIVKFISEGLLPSNFFDIK